MRLSRRLLLANVFVLSVALATAAAQRPTYIPSPRPEGWVVDHTGTLNLSQIAELNALGNEVHKRDGAEFAVVVISTTDGGDHRKFATDLFNHWGIGERNRDNGLLVFVALHDRAAEIILGGGIDSGAEIAKSDRIMQNLMVPQFRSGNNADAIMVGTRACAQEFFTVSNGQHVDIGPEGARDRWVRWGIRTVGSAAAALLAGFGGYTFLRRRPRSCRRCGMTMARLDEISDDEHLSPTEKTEERIKSVDYDVWHCPGCDGVEKFRFGRLFSRYSKCPQCGAKTRCKNEETIVAATTYSSGRMRIHETCEACDFENTSERVIPMVKESSGSSSSGFGGGSSSGGGSSGRW